jgi:hypothetical protein
MLHTSKHFVIEQKTSSPCRIEKNRCLALALKIYFYLSYNMIHNETLIVLIAGPTRGTIVGSWPDWQTAPFSIRCWRQLVR